MKLCRGLMGIALASGIAAGLAGCGENAGFGFGAPRSIESALKDIDVTYVEGQRRANVRLTPTNLLSLLPPIETEYPMPDSYSDNASTEAVEIFTSPEKAAQSGKDAFFTDLANRFNSTNTRLSNGKVVRVNIRSISSGTGAQYILAGRYVPDAYSPSTALWGGMLRARGIELETLADVTTPNVAGIVVKSDKAPQILDERGKLDMAKLITAVTGSQFAMGYTNPFVSSTGLNFLLHTLYQFSNGDEEAMLAPDVASAFEAFQRGVPFVGQNTLQLKNAATGSGVLDALVMESQTYENAKGFPGYEFVPFGVRHDNPLYATAEADASEREALQLFVSYIKSNGKPRSYGFDRVAHTDAYSVSDTIIEPAQRLWKEKKSGGRPIAAVFVVDVSGSMEGDRIKGVRHALTESADLISQTNAIGLVSFNDKVNVDLPIRDFNLQQKALFMGVSEDLTAGGGTASYDAVLVAIAQLQSFLKTNPEHKPVIFILSDGEQTSGFNLESVSRLIQAAQIPVHSIAYGFDSQQLKQLSGQVEAAYVQASEDNAAYKIGNILNAEM